MRLVIAFDEGFNFYDTDLVISDCKPRGILEKQFVKVEVDGLTDYVDDLESFKGHYCNSLAAPVLKDVTRASMNNFHRNFTMPLFAWIETMNRTLSNNKFSEIIIVGYTQDIGYVPYYEAEGEINKRFFYNRSDAIPAVLLKILNNKGLNYTLIKKASTNNLKVRIFIRRYVLLMFKLVLFVYKGLKAKFSSKPELNNTKYSCMMFSRGIAQTEFIEDFIKIHKKEVLLHVADGLVSNKKNADYVRSNNIINTSYYEQQIKLSTVLKSFFIIVKLILKLPKVNYIEIEGVELNFSSAQKEMLISYFEVLIYKNTIKDYIPENVKTLITCEMYTPYAYSVAQIAKEKGMQSIQLQSTAMSIRKEPSYFYADFFFMNTKKSAENLKEIFPNYAKKINFIGNISVNENNHHESNKNRSIKKVIYFSQPIMSEQREEDLLLKKLIYLEKKHCFQLFIKLHPREGTSKFKHIGNLKYITEGLTFGQYICNTDLAIFRTTSLGQRLLINNVPTITCLLTENSRQFNADYIDKSYFGTVQNIDNIESKIVKYNFLLEDFNRFRKEYLTTNNLDKGLNYFYNQLNQL